MKKCILMSVMSFGVMVGLMTGQIQQVLPFNNAMAEMMAALRVAGRDALRAAVRVAVRAAWTVGLKAEEAAV
jgi:hypothetical protein